MTSLILKGTLQEGQNTRTSSVTMGIGTASTADDLTLAPGARRFGGSGQLAIAGFVDVSASFGFEETTTTVGGVTTTRILVAAAGVQTFLGANGTGVRLTDGKIGAVIDRVSGGDTKYALVASGSAALVGISGLTLTGSMEARMNRLDAAIDTTIVTPGGDVRIKFDSADDVTQFGGSANLAIGGFVELSGSFGIEKSGDTLLVGVAGVTAFLGVNGCTSIALGLEVTNGNIGLAITNGS